jgi:hypothetical protein
MNPLKIVITSKKNLVLKYQGQFNLIEKELKKLVAADKKKKLETLIVYLDDLSSSQKAGLAPVLSVTEKNCKNYFDKIYNLLHPAYMVIFGAQDVFPFQELDNNTTDDDTLVPSDLPYACDAGYSKSIASFTNPVRVVGRIPDIPEVADVKYVENCISDIIRQKPIKPDPYQNYFGLTAFVWRQSTLKSVQNIFGQSASLLVSPPAKGNYSKKQLAPLSHFINCHGAMMEPFYYGQKGDKYPISLDSKNLNKNISYGTLVAAECCYGAQLLNPSRAGISIANNYLKNHALSFMGSSTIAYGPSDGQGLADLLCQFYMKNVHSGESTGRALLEARHRFLLVSGPHLDPYELKTIAQFYILGDPSLQLVATEAKTTESTSIENRRIILFNKGISIGNSLNPSEKMEVRLKSKNADELKRLVSEKGFSGIKKEALFKAYTEKKVATGGKKAYFGGKTFFRSYQKRQKGEGFDHYEVLVVKENESQLLGWRMYVSR